MRDGTHGKVYFGPKSLTKRVPVALKEERRVRGEASLKGKSFDFKIQAILLFFIF